MRADQTRSIKPGEMCGTGSRSRVDVAGFQSNASSCAWGDNSSRLPGPESCPRQPRLRYHKPCEGDSVRWVTRGQRCGRTTGLCEVKIIFPVVLFAVNSQQIGRRDDVSFQGTHPSMPSSLQFNAKLTSHHETETETPPPAVYLLLCVRQLLFPTKWRLQ
jgi:hypothetical protein